jgi:regulator of nucleoside diphosphate kinase
MTKLDQERLFDLISKSKKNYETLNNIHILNLEQELKKAVYTNSESISGNVVTMNSIVELIDLDHSEEFTVTLVYPEESDIIDNKISILSPVGTAILGYSINDTIDWTVPDGQIRLLIKNIIYQPEANGDYDV